MKRSGLKGAWATIGLVARFTALHAEGKSFSEIAAAINAEFGTSLTRNAFIGQARRLEFPVRPKPVALARHARVRQRPLPRQPKTKPEPIAPRSKPRGQLTIYQLEYGDCRFPEGVRSPFMFCGQATTNGSSWCAEHHKIVYSKWERRA